MRLNFHSEVEIKVDLILVLFIQDGVPVFYLLASELAFVESSLYVFGFVGLPAGLGRDQSCLLLLHPSDNYNAVINQQKIRYRQGCSVQFRDIRKKAINMKSILFNPRIQSTARNIRQPCRNSALPCAQSDLYIFSSRLLEVFLASSQSHSSSSLNSMSSYGLGCIRSLAVGTFSTQLSANSQYYS